MAKKRTGGSTTNGRDSIKKRLGFKVFGGAVVYPGQIILRQRGSIFYSGAGTTIGKDYTIQATRHGRVAFEKKGKKTIIIINSDTEA